MNVIKLKQKDMIKKKELQIFFTKHVVLYEKEKYPQAAYIKFKKQFSSYDADADISSAIEWKYGHFRKKNYPRTHKAIIAKIKRNWHKYIAIEEVFKPDYTFTWWQNKLGKTAYITAVWITHLIHHKLGIPIIDQHNYRAMKLLKQFGVRRYKQFKKRPSNWKDVKELEGFIVEMKKMMPSCSYTQIDHFLMMYGKHCKERNLIKEY